MAWPRHVIPMNFLAVLDKLYIKRHKHGNLYLIDTSYDYYEDCQHSNRMSIYPCQVGHEKWMSFYHAYSGKLVGLSVIYLKLGKSLLDIEVLSQHD